MEVWLWIVIVAGVGVVILMALLGAMQAGRQRATRRLQSDFGPAYNDALSHHGGNRRAAESDLKARGERVSRLRVHDLTADQRSALQEDWNSVQATFVDDPAKAAHGAENVVERALEARGFPTGDFDQQVADISVDYPHVVQQYRSARGLMDGKGTEDLRQAFVQYRELFVELVNTGGVETRRAKEAVTS